MGCASRAFAPQRKRTSVSSTSRYELVPPPAPNTVARPTTLGACHVRLQLSTLWLPKATRASFEAPAPNPAAAPIAPGPLSGLVWRNLGPFRAGRIAAVSGVVGQPGTFYIGLPLGGVWKTTSAGETWTPVFDAVTAASSVGALEVAPSDPNIIYVGMGDLITGGGINEGDGVYKSSDAGKTWQHLGGALDDTRQIPSILVDPHDPNLVLVAAQGDVHKKSETRGGYRSTDGRVGKECRSRWSPYH